MINEKSLIAPIKKGYTVGRALIYYQNELVKIEPLVVKSDVETSQSTSFIYNTLKIFKSLFFWIAVVVVAAVFFAVKFYKRKK